MDKKKDETIALFRYGIIAPVLNNGEVKQMEYFRQMSKREHDVPFLGTKRYKVCAFKSWLRKYRKGGFDALKPGIRKDKGGSRKINEKVAIAITKKITDFPFLSASALYRVLISEGAIAPTSIASGTVRKYIRDNNLRLRISEQVPRKKYEKEHINELWITDAMHGPLIWDANKKRKTFLISVIDDCSRVIVGAHFFFQENSVSLEIVLKEAFSRFGLPNVLYCDNGSIFVSSHLNLACARLGIALVHSKPYDSPSRGKIERYHRTIRQKFLPLLNQENDLSLIELNTSFDAWLDKEYQKAEHSGIAQKPMDKWTADLKQTKIKRVTTSELDLAFYVTIERKVKNDSTVMLNNLCYEVPYKFIGKKVEIRYPINNPLDLHLYDNNKPIAKLKLVNPIENANLPYWGIKFTKQGDNS